MHSINGATTLEKFLDIVEPTKICVLLEVDRTHNFDDLIDCCLNVDKIDKMLWRLEKAVDPIPEFQTGLVYRNGESTNNLTSGYSFLDPALSWQHYQNYELFLVLRPNWDLEAFLGGNASMKLRGKVHGITDSENLPYTNIWIGSMLTT